MMVLDLQTLPLRDAAASDMSPRNGAPTIPGSGVSKFNGYKQEPRAFLDGMRTPQQRDLASR